MRSQRDTVRASLTCTAAHDMGGPQRRAVEPRDEIEARNARRAFMNGRLWQLADTEAAGGDTDRLTRLIELVGDVASAHNHAHADVDSELLRVAGCVLAWLDDSIQRRSL